MPRIAKPDIQTLGGGGWWRPPPAAEVRSSPSHPSPRAVGIVIPPQDPDAGPPGINSGGAFECVDEQSRVPLSSAENKTNQHDDDRNARRRPRPIRRIASARTTRP